MPNRINETKGPLRVPDDGSTRQESLAQSLASVQSSKRAEGVVQFPVNTFERINEARGRRVKLLIDSTKPEDAVQFPENV